MKVPRLRGSVGRRWGSTPPGRKNWSEEELASGSFQPSPKYMRLCSEADSIGPIEVGGNAVEDEPRWLSGDSTGLLDLIGV